VYRQDGTLEYSGQWRGVRKHGVGTLYHNDGKTEAYQGEWEDDLKHGSGKLSNSAGKPVYEGNFAHGSPRGEGKRYVYLPDGSLQGTLQGNFKEMQVCLDVTWYRPNGTVFYKGDISNGKMHDVGETYEEDGSLRYAGQFMKGKCHGIGTCYSRGRISYTGSMEDGLCHGKGRCFSKKGILLYDGDWRKGKPQGYGDKYREDGTLLYSGQFSDGKVNGLGELYGEDGTLFYTGEFADGKAHGAGTRYHNTFCLKGLFEHNSPCRVIMCVRKLDATPPEEGGGSERKRKQPTPEERPEKKHRTAGKCNWGKPMEAMTPVEEELLRTYPWAGEEPIRVVVETAREGFIFKELRDLLQPIMDSTVIHGKVEEPNQQQAYQYVSRQNTKTYVSFQVQAYLKELNGRAHVIAQTTSTEMGALLHAAAKVDARLVFEQRQGTATFRHSTTRWLSWIMGASIPPTDASRDEVIRERIRSWVNHPPVSSRLKEEYARIHRMEGRPKERRGRTSKSTKNLDKSCPTLGP